MARPSLFIRRLEPAEMEHLARFRKSGRQAVRQRAYILLASLAYTPVWCRSEKGPRCLAEKAPRLDW